MKHFKSRLVTLLIAFMLIFAFQVDSIQAASLTASNLSELSQIIRTQGMARNSDFTVTFKGSDAELSRLFGNDFSFFYYDMIVLDDASTTDDSDYLIGNIDFSKDCMTSSGDDIKFTFKYFETKEQTDYVNQRTNEILAELGVANMSNYEKVKAVHDYVCGLITYKDDAENYSSVYGAYTDGQGLCNSYALCMCKLLTTAGVPCRWIGGKAGTGRDSDGHAWNIVELGDKWYYLDATWDDQEDGYNYDYFLKGSSDFDSADPSQAHQPDAEYSTSNYWNVFPLAETSFQAGANDTNTTIVPNVPTVTTPEPTPNVVQPNSENTGVVQNPDSAYDDEPVVETYNFKDIIDGKYPSNGSLSVKKKKTKDIQLFIKNKTAKSLISKISYKVTSGKKYITTKNYGICKDGSDYFYDLAVKGKKKGTSKITVTVKLKNGQSKNYTFKAKVK